MLIRRMKNEIGPTHSITTICCTFIQLVKLQWRISRILNLLQSSTCRCHDIQYLLCGLQLWLFVLSDALPWPPQHIKQTSRLGRTKFVPQIATGRMDPSNTYSLWTLITLVLDIQSAEFRILICTPSKMVGSSGLRTPPSKASFGEIAGVSQARLIAHFIAAAF